MENGDYAGKDQQRVQYESNSHKLEIKEFGNSDVTGCGGSPPTVVQYDLHFWRATKNLLGKETRDVVTLLEMKKEVCDRNLVHSIWMTRYRKWVEILTIKALGGILIIWTLGYYHALRWW